MIVDALGKEFKVGDTVVKGFTQFNYLGTHTVTRVTDKHVYLDNSPQGIKCPGRLAIVEPRPLSDVDCNDNNPMDDVNYVGHPTHY